MSDSLAPDSNKRQPDEDAPTQDPTPTTGFVYDDLGNPERGLESAENSLTGEPGQIDPAETHRRRIRDSGSATPEDSGDAVPELAGDDQSLLTGNPPGTKPM